jgi:hypothetical protein
MMNPIALGIIEFTCAILLAIPFTRKIGFYLVIAYLGGIMVAEQALTGKPYMGIVLSVVLWIGMYLRNPKMFSFDK